VNSSQHRSYSVAGLEEQLRLPAADETCARPRGAADRLGALRELAARVPPPPRRAGVNLHVHTGKSFSLFYSPAAACWQARKEGLEFFGINDHYTVAGHPEFREACRILGLKAGFSMEAIALDDDSRRQGLLLNDPDNPGRTYFTAKGVTRALGPNSHGARALQGVNAALTARHQRMVELAADWLAQATARPGLEPVAALAWDDVLGRTPHGNVTERHVAGAIADALLRASRNAPDLLPSACAAWFGAPPESLNPAPFQNYIRKHLLKAGKPCYVEESPQAYLSLQDMKRVYLEMGSIPSYPILGNPITGVEKDIHALLDRMAGLGVLAFEVIPYRNTRERLREIVNACRERHAPLFTGTEHNSLDVKPLVDPLSKDPEFAPFFEASARVLLGHQEAVRRDGPGAGFVDPDGQPTIPDAAQRFAHFEAIGKEV